MLISYKNANIYQRHGICVLKNVNFRVDEGQFIYLIGRVGSGKTTLMRTLYCELDMDEADEYARYAQIAVFFHGRAN